MESGPSPLREKYSFYLSMQFIFLLYQQTGM